jgi:hypothetical protein
MIIELDDNDIRVASHVAFDRGLTSVLAGARNVNGGMEDPFLRHVIGALGECAVAKAFDIYWDGSVGRFRGMGSDVGSFQVRARSDKLPLIIRPADSNEDVFILVYMTDSTYRKWNIAGWVTGSQGKKIGQLTNMQGGQRYQVAIAQLEDIDRLVPA